MKRFCLPLILFISACQLPAEKKAQRMERAIAAETTSLRASDTNAAEVLRMDEPQDRPLPKLREPQGIFSTRSADGQEQIVEFLKDRTFRLQEMIAPDSNITITGNWSPSAGYIWLYKDQVLRARYKWKGDTLQFYNPKSKHSESMQELQDVSRQTAWELKSASMQFFGIGTEPFWSIEIGRNDSLVLSTPETQVRGKIQLISRSADSTVFANDSITVVVIPEYCRDGMSDQVYPNHVSVRTPQQRFSGCGASFRK